MATCSWETSLVANRAPPKRLLYFRFLLCVFGHYAFLELKKTLHSPDPRKAQETAASAMSWCASNGGVVKSDDIVRKISLIGTSGKHPANAERDMHTLIASFCKRFGAKVSTARVRTGVYVCTDSMY